VSSGHFLLDTDTCIYALKQHARVIERLLAAAREDVVVSVITEAELRTGAAKSSSPSKTLSLVENFLAPIARIEFTSDDAIAYATIRSKLERRGTPIGPLDTLIAAQAVARRLVLVSNNEREFRRVPGLTLENWSR
jgi:tRNA(fMet)-specific endonuclease VapC